MLGKEKRENASLVSSSSGFEFIQTCMHVFKAMLESRPLVK
jgi:hypothetical protein